MGRILGTDGDHGGICHNSGQPVCKAHPNSLEASFKHNSLFNEDEEEEETVHTPKTQIKRRKRSMRDDREEDPKVILCSEERSGVY